MTQNVNLPTTTTYQPEPAYQAPAPAPASYFTDMALFEAGQRMAKLLCASGLVPQQFRNNIPDTLIALEMAARTGSSPLAVMQSMYVVHGRPSWSATFIIAAITGCGRFSPLRFEMKGEGDGLTCRAWAVEKASGEALYGPPVSIATAKKEGWFSKQGSKWQTMPELMLHYRAATLFGRIYAADVLMGMKADDELDDIGPDAFRRMNGEKPGAAVDVPPARPKGAAAIDELLAEGSPEPAIPDEAGNPPENAGQSAEDSSSPAAPRNDGDGKAEPPEGETPAEADAGLPENLKRYLEAKEGKKPRRPAEPQQQTLPAGEPEEIAEYRAAARRCMDEIDGIDDPEALKNWWQRRDYTQTVREIGGMNSEWHQAVVDHLNDRIKLLEAKR